MCLIDFVYLVPRFPFYLFIDFLIRFRICQKIFMNEYEYEYELYIHASQKINKTILHLLMVNLDTNTVM